MSTFFGSEALVSYTEFIASVTTSGAIYTVPTGFYAEVFIQSVEAPALSGISFRVGLNTPVDLPAAAGPSALYDLSYEVFPSQTFNILSITGSGPVVINYRVKVFAKP